MLFCVQPSTGPCELRYRDGCTGPHRHFGHNGGLLMLLLRQANSLISDQLN